MNDLLTRLAYCIERGKLDRDSKYPKDLEGTEGSVELTRSALSEGMSANEILNKGLLTGMERVGVKFKNGEYYIPDVLLASKAMKGAMAVLKPYFQSGELVYKGNIVIGTVKGDLHDIGKNLVGMVLEGGGWEVTDIGIDSDSGEPTHTPETMETNIAGLYVAGGIAAGRQANKIFIENGRLHGARIVEHILSERS